MLNTHFIDCDCNSKTRMHSSRMCTTCLLPISQSMHCSWYVYLVPGGVPGPGGCTWYPTGVPGLKGVHGPMDVYQVLGVYLVPGGVPGPVGGTCPGTPPVNRMTDRQV